MSEAHNGLKAGENHPMFGRKHSPETLEQMSTAKQGENNPMFGKPKPEGSGSLTKRIASFDKDTQATTVYTSMREAARTMFFPKSSESL